MPFFYYLTKLIMRSIKARFNKLYKEPLSSYLAFSRSVRNQRFTLDSISRNFTKLVEKDDYDIKDKNTLIKHLYKLSNPSEEHEIES